MSGLAEPRGPGATAHCIKYHSNHFKNAILLVILISTRVAPLPGVKQGVKWSKKLNETWIFGFEPLLFSHSWINFEKPSQKLHFLTYFGRFWRLLFNSDGKVVAETKKNEFLDDFHFIWHPTWPQECNPNGLKWFEGYLIQCASSSLILQGATGGGAFSFLSKK